MNNQIIAPVPELTLPALSPEDYSNLNRVERNLNTLFETIDKLESCGADCQALRAVIADSQHRISNMKKHFPPR